MRLHRLSSDRARTFAMRPRLCAASSRRTSLVVCRRSSVVRRRCAYARVLRTPASALLNRRYTVRRVLSVETMPTRPTEHHTHTRRRSHSSFRLKQSHIRTNECYTYRKTLGELFTCTPISHLKVCLVRSIVRPVGCRPPVRPS